MTLSLLACGLSAAPSTDSTADSGTDDSAAPVDTSETGEEEEEEEILWTKYKLDEPLTVRGLYSSGSGVYVVTSRGQAFVGSASEAWTSFSLPAELSGLDINGMWATGAESTLEIALACDAGYVATYQSGAWTTHYIGSRDNLDIDGSSMSDLFVVGDNGIHHWDGSGWTYEEAPPVTMNAVYAWGSGAMAVGNEGVAMRRDAEGNWATSDTGKAANLRGVDGSSGSDIWAVGDLGALLHWDGGDWSNPASDTSNSLNAVFVDSANSVIAVGNTGTSLKYDGSKWRLRATDTNQNLYAVHGVSGVNAWGGGDGGVVMQYKE